MALNPFTGLQPPDSGSEQIVQAKPVVLEEAVEKAYNVYECLDTPLLTVETNILIAELEEQILTPSQIDSLLQVMISGTEPMKLNRSTAGKYLARLIQDSYDAGNNDFVLTTRDTHINYIGYKLSGSKEKRLRICINGNAGYFCGFITRSSEIIIYGNAGNHSGLWSIDTNFTAHNEQAYGMFKEYADCDRGNTIRLVNSKGKVIKEEHL